MNGRAVARRSEFLKKLSKKMTVRSASTINRMGGKSYEIQTHSNMVDGRMRRRGDWWRSGWRRGGCGIRGRGVGMS